MLSQDGCPGERLPGEQLPDTHRVPAHGEPGQCRSTLHTGPGPRSAGFHGAAEGTDTWQVQCPGALGELGADTGLGLSPLPSPLKAPPCKACLWVPSVHLSALPPTQCTHPCVRPHKQPGALHPQDGSGVPLRGTPGALVSGRMKRDRAQGSAPSR